MRSSSHGQGGRQLVRLQATRLPSLPVPGGVSFFLFFLFLFHSASERAAPEFVFVGWRESWTRARKLNAARRLSSFWSLSRRVEEW